MSGSLPVKNPDRPYPMRKKETIERAKNYVALSNQHHLPLIKPLFADDATYYSAYSGEYKDSAAIHAMMTDFFTRFPDAHWEVPEYRCTEDYGIEFDFVMTGTDASSGERVRRQGSERIYFTPEGLIRHIAVFKPDENPQRADHSDHTTSS